MNKTLLATALLTLPLALNAQILNEVGDAGQLPGTAQAATGAGSLTTILGSLSAGSDVDMYVIRIPNPATFVATTVLTTTAFSDTQVYLFALNGTGLSFNDDATTATLFSTVTGQYLPGPGCYLLAIGSFNNPARNSLAQNIWALTPFEIERQPDGPGAGAPVVTQWAGTGTGFGAYEILLTGAEFFGGGAGTIALNTLSNCQGLTSLTVTGNPNLSGTLTATINGATGAPFIAWGFAPNTILQPAPLLCPCEVLLATAAFPSVNWLYRPNLSRSITIPCWNILVGLTLKTQGADFFPSGPAGCPASTISFTDVYAATIGQ